MDPELLRDLQIDDLPPDLQDVAESCGLDVVQQLVDEFGGTVLSIPKPTRAYRPAIARFIDKNYNGRNASELARRLGISRTTVYEIVRCLHHPAKRSFGAEN